MNSNVPLSARICLLMHELPWMENFRENFLADSYQTQSDDDDSVGTSSRFLLSYEKKTEDIYRRRRRLCVRKTFFCSFFSCWVLRWKTSRKLNKKAKKWGKIGHFSPPPRAQQSESEMNKMIQICFFLRVNPDSPRMQEREKETFNPIYFDREEREREKKSFARSQFTVERWKLIIFVAGKKSFFVCLSHFIQFIIDGTTTQHWYSRKSRSIKMRLNRCKVKVRWLRCHRTHIEY